MDENALNSLRSSVKDSRQRFLAVIEPLRPDLFRFACGLTPTVWDAEDLVQEALTRAFANLGRFDEVRKPRSYLFRIATNAWLDQQARKRPSALPEELDMEDETEWVPSVEVREALESLARTLPPRERVAVLLFDVFGFSLAETAQSLMTTVGAVKAALSRGRKSLRDEREADAPNTRTDLPEGLMDSFVEAFNARDLERLLSLLSPDAMTEVVGVAASPGPDAARNVLRLTLEEAALRRAECIAYRGDWIVLLWHECEGQEVVGEIVRIEQFGGQLTRYRSYYFAPEVLSAVGAELGAEVVTHGRCVPA
ncbi:MAG: sigma-70 family RNA polymerase sigma factor [Planctomycetota bacterium]|jgi:RNA polymerase sigma-70 factor (ECF subfamily)